MCIQALEEAMELADKAPTRREFLKRAAAVAWVAPVMTAVQAAPALAGVQTSATTTSTTSTTVPED